MSAPLQALAQANPGQVVAEDAQGALDAQALRALVERWRDRLAASTTACVASRLDNGREALAIELATRAAGLAHVPLPPYFSDAQVRGALDRSGADRLVLPPGSAVPAGWRAADASACASVLLQREVPAADLPRGSACITFTSGSSGEPRGVCLDGALLDRVATSLEAATRPLRPRRHLCALPLATLLEQVAGIHAALLADAQILLPGLAELGYSGAAGLDPARLLACLQRHQPESVILLPQLLLALVARCEAGERLPASLKYIAVGGARVGAALLARAARLGLPVFEGYGLSECGSVVCLNRPGAARAGSVGQPLPHVRVSVSDERELMVEGAAMLGYLGDAAGPPSPLPTGDLGWVDADGYVHIDGRRKNMFITSFGRNVSPEWVESELVQHPAIAQAIVFGEARPCNVALLVPRRAEASERELRRALDEVNAGLPDYARVAHHLRIPCLSVDDGLLTANGRPRRDAIARRHGAALDALYRDHTLLEGALSP